MSRTKAVICMHSGSNREAQALARFLGCQLVDDPLLLSLRSKALESDLRERFIDVGERIGYLFLFYGDRLLLAQLTNDGMVTISADFLDPTLNYRRTKGGGKRQMIAKAVGLGSGLAPHVWDATAGLGRDAFMLASLGCPVTMFERVPEVRALLRHALTYARVAECADEGFFATLKRMHLIEGDARESLSPINANSIPDVIYLDPMFPTRTKSALVKKEMRIFHDLVGDDGDAAELLEASLAACIRRVVVKRPRLSDPLSGRKPSYQLVGKRNRFDVYLCSSA